MLQPVQSGPHSMSFDFLIKTGQGAIGQVFQFPHPGEFLGNSWPKFHGHRWSHSTVISLHLFEDLGYANAK